MNPRNALRILLLLLMTSFGVMPSANPWPDDTQPSPWWQFNPAEPPTCGLPPWWPHWLGG